MKTRIAELLPFAFRNLPWIVDIHRIGETIVCLRDFGSLVPAPWLEPRLPARQRRFSRADAAKMLLTEGLARLRTALAGNITLAFVGTPCFRYFPGSPPFSASLQNHLRGLWLYWWR